MHFVECHLPRMQKAQPQHVALTFGQQDIPPMAQKMSKKQQRLNNRQYCCRIRRSGDMALMSLTLGKTIPTVADLLAIGKVYHFCSK
jgi:hypothetical protein